jgi:hypothetical protein
VTANRRPTQHRLGAFLILLGLTLAAAMIARAQEPAASKPTQAQLQQLVTPIALYPDSLVAQILAAAQYPTQIVEADRFVSQNSSMSASQRSAAAARQDWDPSVMALVSFPSVLHNMDQNLSWTSALGEAYYNDSAGVMQAIQTMRSRAYEAGTLKTTPQQTVTVQSGGSGTQTIIIQPSNPEVVYVPTYNPTVVYGAPATVYPGYTSTDMMASALLGFGTGVAVGAIAGSAWGCNWGGGSVTYNNNVYVAHNNVWGPNRWGPYNPYHPYNPYNPYHPYQPYNPNHPYNPYHPYAGNQYHPYNASNAYNRSQYNQTHPYGQTGQYNRSNQNYANRQASNWNANRSSYQGGFRSSGNQRGGLNNYRGYDQHADSGLGDRGAFGDFGGAGDTRMASDRGFSSMGWNRGGGGGGGFGHGGFGGHGFGGFGGRR